MGLLQKLADYREKQIVANLTRYSDASEEIVQWVRAGRTEGRGDGFVFITDAHCVIHLSGRKDGSGAVSWSDIQSWGIIDDEVSGPILGIETHDHSYLVRLRVSTARMAEEVAAFVDRFAEMAPEPRWKLKAGRHLGRVSTSGRVNIKQEKKTVATHTRKVVVTLVGMGLIAIAALIGFLPGPWSIPLVIAGLAVLAREYDWAKDLLEWFKEKRTSAVNWLKRRTQSSE